MKLFLVSSLGEKKLSRDQSWGSRKAARRRLQDRDMFRRLSLSKNEKRWSKHSWLRFVRYIGKRLKTSNKLRRDLVCWDTRRNSSGWGCSLFYKAWIHDSFAGRLFLTHGSRAHIRSERMGVILRGQQQAKSKMEMCEACTRTHSASPSVRADVWTAVACVYRLQLMGKIKVGLS